MATILLLGLLNTGLILSFIAVIHVRHCSLSVSLYRDVKHYGQHMHFKSDCLPVLICSKSETFDSLQRGTVNESVTTATS